MKIDHIGYAVKDIEKAKKSMSTLGFIFGKNVEDTARNVLISFGELDGYRIELVASLETSISCPIDLYISKIGPTPYHICYRSKNIEADMERLTKARFKISIPLAPAIAFGGRRVVFMYSLSAGLIEIVEEK